LERQRQGVDLIQEEGPARGRLEEPRLGPFSIGEGASGHPVELGLEQGLRDRRTVDLDAGAVGARATVMDDPRDQSLPRAGLTAQQDSGDVWMTQAVESGQVPNLGV
jgi:hypothetical protein